MMMHQRVEWNLRSKSDVLVLPFVRAISLDSKGGR